MSEYDSSFVFVPLRKLQELRGMIDPHDRHRQRHVDSDQAASTSVDGDMRARQAASRVSAASCTAFSTWRDKQGPLLAAVQMETAILNMLLFLIIAVAGFGILAIFFMIVVEKTRDIGILKSLGASSRGVMGIFLGYGLSLGIVGVGRRAWCSGCCSSRYINEIADLLGMAHRPAGLRPVDLLLPQDSDDRRAVDRRLDRGRGDVDRRDGQHSAGAARRPTASGGGIAL